ncbi:MAG: type II toxin-antitoxin system HicB family antitoxin [Planctomycetes bacterium]|nr:type II toxin-antitoxin system HicB family antitoxin [Planctomycetota bacterium]
MSEFMVRLEVRPLPEGGFLATSKDLQGLIAQGRTVAETLEIARDVARRLVESRIENGEPVKLRGVAGRKSGLDLTIPVAVEG